MKWRFAVLTAAGAPCNTTVAAQSYPAREAHIKAD